MTFLVRCFPLLLLAASGVFAQTSQSPHVGKLPGGGFLLNNGWTLRPAGESVPVDTLPMSSAVSNDGKYLLVLNAGFHQPSVSVIDIAKKQEVSRFKLPDAWLGLAVSPRGNRVYVGGATGAVVYELTLDSSNGTLSQTRVLPAVADLNNKGQSFIGDVRLRSDGRVLYAADLLGDSIAAIDLDTGKLLGRFKCGRRPYRLLLSPDDKTLLVSSWADGSIYTYDANHGNQLTQTRVAPQLTDMVWVNQPPPVEGGKDNPYVARVFVAAENTNSVYALGVTAAGQLSRLESINLGLTPLYPLGMTPSALAVNKEGTHLYVACSNANLVAAVNIAGPGSIVAGVVPTGWYPTAVRELQDGSVAIVNGKSQTVSFVPALTPASLNHDSEVVLQNSPNPGAPVPAPPIQHVLYILKSGGTYDEVLGDLKKGNGDSTRVKFGEQVTPNLHELARQFVLYDNFYVNGDVLADGLNWATAAIVPDFTEKLWPSSAAHRLQRSDFLGGEPANLPAAGFLWDNAKQAGISFQNYPDAKNWKGFDENGQAPQLTMLRVTGDEKESDAVLGRIVDTVSHSKLWSSTAIFIVETNTGGGSDHVDTHRAPVWVISPYTHRASVDSHMYNSTSVLRTIEQIVGLHPMTQFDAASQSMLESFSQQANVQPYTAK